MDTKRLRDAVKTFDSSKGSEGAIVCKGGWSPNSKRLCEYAMQAIVTKMSSGKNSAVKPIGKIHLSLEEFLPNAVSFRARIEGEIRLLSNLEHMHCTPFRSKLPSLSTLKTTTLQRWGTSRTLNAFEKQARVSGLEKGGGDDEVQDVAGRCSASRKRSCDESEALESVRMQAFMDLVNG